MAQKINPDSVHLGGDSSGYYAEYTAIPKEEQPPSCLLPGGITLNLTPAPLLPLNEACAFEFPGVLALPPVYNPPQVKFLACETFEADTQITTCPATKNTRLTLIASGPIPPEEKNGAASCSLTLAGNICVEACEEFTASATVRFSDAMKGSKISLDSRSIPDCGVDLFADLVVNACETFDAKADIKVTGSGNVVQRSNWDIVKSSIPDCGFTLTGDVNIKACEDFTASGGIKFTGSTGVVNVLSPIRVVPSHSPDCGVTLEGAVDIKACRDFTVNGGMAFTGRGVSGGISITPTHSPDCGLNISGSVQIDACKEIAASGVVTVKSSDPNAASGYVRLIPSNDGCGVQLDGSIGINACSEVQVSTGRIQVTAKRGGGMGEIWIQNHARGGCGVNLMGNIDVTACNTVSASVEGAEPLTINFTNGEKTVGTLELQPWIYTGVANEGCEITLQHGISSPTTTIDIGGGGEISVGGGSVGTTTGCFYTEEDALRLEYDKINKSLSLAGKIPLPSFACDAGSCAGGDSVFSDIELNSLNVNSISTSSCCGGSSKLDLCGASLDLRGGDGSANLFAGGCNIYGSEGEARISPGQVILEGNGGSVNIYSPSGVNMSPVLITVCVNGESRDMYVIGSAPL